MLLLLLGVQPYFSYPIFCDLKQWDDQANEITVIDNYYQKNLHFHMSLILLTYITAMLGVWEATKVFWYFCFCFHFFWKMLLSFWTMISEYISNSSQQDINKSLILIFLIPITCHIRQCFLIYNIFICNKTLIYGDKEALY